MEDNEKDKVEEVSEEVQPEPEEPKEVPKTSRKTKPKVLLAQTVIPIADSLEVIRARKQAHQLKLRGGK